MAPQLSVFRVCRFTDFYFVGIGVLAALKAELVARIGAFPRISPLLPRLLAEFKEYHTIANTARGYDCL